MHQSSENALARADFRALGERSAMRVVFSDESGTGDKDDPLTVVAAMLVDADVQWEPFTKDFRMAAIQVPEDQRQFVLEREMHEVKGDRLFRALRRRPECYAGTLLREIAKLPARHRVPIFYGAVDRAAIARKKEVHRDELFLDQKTDIHLDAAFRECIEQVERWSWESSAQERLVWIADDPARHVRTVASASRLLDFVRITNLDREVNRTSRVIDTIFFGHSRDSHALQIVDVLTSIIRERLLDRDDARPFYEELQPMIVDEGRPISYAT